MASAVALLSETPQMVVTTWSLCRLITVSVPDLVSVQGTGAIGLVDHIRSRRVGRCALQDRDHGGVDAHGDGGEDRTKTGSVDRIGGAAVGIGGLRGWVAERNIDDAEAASMDAITLVENDEPGADGVEVSPDGVQLGAGRGSGDGVAAERNGSRAGAWECRWAACPAHCWER